MATRLAKSKIQELSLVFSRDPESGSEFAPRNPEARILGLKAGEKKTNLFQRFVERLKSGFPVSSEVADNVDSDGDGSDDYNSIAGLLAAAYCDLQAACAINDDDARSAAVCAVLDGFREDYDAIYSGGDESDKAGARHSASDLERLQAIADAQKGLGQHLEAISGALKDLGITGSDGPVEGEQGPEVDEGPNSSQVDDDADKADVVKAIDEWVPGEVGDDGLPVNFTELESLCEKAGNSDKKNKPYGDVEYADPANGKYPIDTEEHVRAAWSYINMPKNASKYSAEELASVKSKIRAAAKKYGIEISDDKSGPLEETQDEVLTVSVKAEDIAPIVAEEISKALQAQRAEFEKQIAVATSEAERAKSDKAAAEERERLATETLRAASGLAARPTAGSASVDKSGPSRLQMAIRAQMAGNTIPTRF